VEKRFLLTINHIRRCRQSNPNKLGYGNNETPRY